ncbi:MAG TPA: hypothetical protein VGM18_17650 [Candidatus Sulfotelmatobacter sp.]
MRKFAFFAIVFAFSLVASLASAQQGDAMFGFGTVVDPTGSGGCNVSTLTCPEKGGLYPNIGADVIFHKRLGVGFDAVWRGGQGAYGGPGGEPYRPLIFDFNGVYQPKINKKTGLDLMGGIGWQSTRFYGYQPTTSCVYFGACYQSSNHFLVDVGAGLRYYFFGHFFLRPEAHYYHIVNNNVDFNNNDIIRVGASIGYTIGPD